MCLQLHVPRGGRSVVIFDCKYCFVDDGSFLDSHTFSTGLSDEKHCHVQISAMCYTVESAQLETRAPYSCLSYCFTNTSNTMVLIVMFHQKKLLLKSSKNEIVMTKNG